MRHCGGALAWQGTAAAPTGLLGKFGTLQRLQHPAGQQGMLPLELAEGHLCTAARQLPPAACGVQQPSQRQPYREVGRLSHEGTPDAWAQRLTACMPGMACCGLIPMPMTELFIKAPKSMPPLTPFMGSFPSCTPDTRLR